MIIFRIDERHLREYGCKFCEELLKREYLTGKKGPKMAEIKIDFQASDWQFGAVPVAYDLARHTCPLNLHWILVEAVKEFFKLSDD